METNFMTTRYIADGMIRRFKTTKDNPKDFIVGDKYIVIGISTHIQVVNSEKNAEKLNNSILNEKNIRKVLE